MNPAKALRLLASCFAIAAAPAIAAGQTAEWKDVGNSEEGSIVNLPGLSSGLSYGISLAVDAEGHPVVAWGEFTNSHANSRVLVKRWDGSSWVGYGESAEIPGSNAGAYQPLLAIDKQGHPSVAWSTGNAVGAPHVYFKRWDGKAWVELGGSATGGGVSGISRNGPESWDLVHADGLKLDRDGNPGVSYTSKTLYSSPFDGLIYVNNVYFKRWDARLSSWVGLDGSDTGLGLSGYGFVKVEVPSEVDPEDPTKYIYKEITVSEGSADLISLALDSSGNPAIAWYDSQYSYVSHSTVHNSLYFRRWNGAAWEELDHSASGSGLHSLNGGQSNIGPPPLELDSEGNPAIAWTHYGMAPGSYGFSVYFKRWNGKSKKWEELAGSATDSGVFGIDDGSAGVWNSSVKLKLDSAGTPSIAWLYIEPFRHVEAYFKRWRTDLGIWEELGGSASGEGVPFPAGPIDEDSTFFLLDLALDPSGAPIIVRPTEDEIHIRKWVDNSFRQPPPSPSPAPAGDSDGSGGGRRGLACSVAALGHIGLAILLTFLPALVVTRRFL